MSSPAQCAADRRSPPLSRDLVRAAAEIEAVLASRDRAYGKSRQTSLTPSVSDLVYRGLRCWGLSQIRLQRLATKPPPIAIRSLLAIVWGALRETLRPDHVLVSEAVTAARHLGGIKTARFVNALLRRTLADPVAAQTDEQHPEARWNAPLWWIEKVQQQYPLAALEILQALSSRAPLTVRVCGPAPQAARDYLAELEMAGLRGWQVGPSAVTITPAVAVSGIPGFIAGRVSVQDAAAQRIVEVLDPARLPSSRLPMILDACAAPGGKSLALAQTCSAVVWALDVAPQRLARLRSDLGRVEPTLRGQIRPVVGDVLETSFWEKGAGAAGMPEVFDAIVLDAPCSASGVVRRHPDIAWRRTPEDIVRVVDIQRRMLDVLWRRLAVGGEFVFVTCSIFQEEGEDQVRDFLARTPDARPLSTMGRILPVSNAPAGVDQDGFFFAKFFKVSVDDPSSSPVSCRMSGAFGPVTASH